MRPVVALLLIAALTACGQSNPGGATGAKSGQPSATGKDPGAAKPVSNRVARPAGTQPDRSGLDPNDLRLRIFEAHGGDIWLSKAAVTGRIVVEYTGTEVIKGQFYYEPRTGRTRIDQDNGSSMIWDGKRAWTTGTILNPGQVRFHVRAWMQIFALPFKLADPGTIYEPKEKRSLLWEDRETGLITFEPGVGDSRDWYWFYADSATNRLIGTGFIVSYGRTPEAAEKQSQSIIYEAFDTFEGVTLATHWRLHGWLTTGPGGSRLGNMDLDDIRFIDDPRPDLFTAPAGATEDKVPVPAPEPKSRPAEPAGPKRGG